jgi:uncharacterized protein
LFEPVVLLYCGVYFAALILAVLHRKTFPLGEALAVVPIVGFGFTGLVYLVTLPLAGVPTLLVVGPAELTFTVVYLAIVAALLVRGPPVPAAWSDQFLKRKAAVLGFKLVVFVAVPLSAARLFWGASWKGLGFTLGDLPGQLGAAAVLILLFGGFNLTAGRAAEPIRKRQISLRQAAFGLGLAFAWNIAEVGLVEEFFLRAFLQSRLAGFWGSPLAGICAASLMFGLAHAPGIFLRQGDRHGSLGKNPTLLNAVLYED